MPSMTVAQNLYLGRGAILQPPARHLHRRAAVPAVAATSTSIRPRSSAARRRAEADGRDRARRACTTRKVIIFDEPTATLTPEEKKSLLRPGRRLKKRGVSVIFISHALEEALQVVRPHHVLRDGEHVVTDADPRLRPRAASCRRWSAATSRRRCTARARRSARPQGRRVLSVQNLSHGGSMVRNTSFSVFAGQITGVFGLVGSGPHRDVEGRRRRGQARLLSRRRGAARTGGRSATRVPRPAVRDGIVYVTEDRKIEGFFETMSIAEQHLSRRCWPSARPSRSLVVR